MTCLISISFPATTFNLDQRRMATIIVAARSLAAYVLGARLCGVALDGGCDYHWKGISGAEVVELETIIQAIGVEVARQSEEDGVRGRWRCVPPHRRPAAREILSRADVQRAMVRVDRGPADPHGADGG